MPELPEVETIANGVHRRVQGDTIVSAWFGKHKEPFKIPASTLAAALPGNRIDQVHRVGKHIVIDLQPASHPDPGKGREAHTPGRPVLEPASQPDPGKGREAHTPGRPVLEPASQPDPGKRREVRTPGRPVLEPASQPDSGKRREAHTPGRPVLHAQLVVHLGMTGRLLVSSPDLPLPPHTHAVLSLASGRELRFVDPRRFGRLALQTASPFTGPGHEPLTISPADFAVLFRGRKLSIKAALLNQSLLHGVGNIYADESLFRAGIRPTRAAGRLTRIRLDRLLKSLRSVLKAAIRAGGSSVSDYVDADGEAGFFQIQHRVYAREGQPCLVCGTPIRRIVLGGRSTHFCPHCQT